jgi:putative DNA primase/helicase
LVICQQKYDEWLQKAKLPPNIYIEHYYNVEGRDEYRDVALQILIGRTAPGPRITERMAGILFGAQPKAAGDWYERRTSVIRLQDGSGRRTKSDRHPDAGVESVRKQTHEAPLEQGEGRGRGVNRDARSPLQIDRLFDTNLGGVVNKVVLWEEVVPSLLINTAAEGVMLTNQSDMAKAFPKLWPNVDVAKRTLKAGVPELPGFTRVTYQRAGGRQKRRLAYFDLALIPEPAAWLKARLGAVVVVE